MNSRKCFVASCIATSFSFLAMSIPSALAVTYQYAGPMLSGFAPYSGNPITATVTFRNADVIPLLGTGGSLGGDSVNGNDDFVESFSFSVGPGTTIDSLNASFSFWQFTFDAALGITQWEANVEADLGRGNPGFPEMIYARNPGDLAGTDDTFPNQSDFFVLQFASASSSGSWTLAVPEPSTIALGALALGGFALRRRVNTGSSC